MKPKKAYKSIELVEFTTVAGNIRDLIQGYSIKYYPKANDLPNKIALCIHLKKPEIEDPKKQPMPRYLFIESTEQLKDLIFNLTSAYFYFKDKKTSPVSRERFRIINLSDFLKKLEEHQREVWRQGSY